ncbi:MAG TPA: trypsin-like serine protease, partial [Kofleriaceae bacterium]
MRLRRDARIPTRREGTSMRLMKMRGITTTVALSLAMVAIGAGPVLAFTPPAVTDAPSLEHDAVVSVAIWGGSPGCTGVLVTPTLVLTAGHCLGRGTIDGGSGIWNSQAPAFRPYEVNAPDPAPGWVTGLKGSSIITADQRFPSAQRYRSESVASAASCRAACDAESVCHGWDYESASTTCELMQERMVVYFGNNHSAFTYQAVSSSYSLPGRADIAMLKLDAPVPANVATPVPVMTYNYSTQAGIHDFLAAQTYQAVGNSPARTTRQTVAMTFNQYPLNGTDLMMVRMAGAGGSTVEGGDSGSPLFILRQMPDGSTKRFVIGICQGIEGGGGRYTLTGANLARQGELLQFIYNPATVDRTQAAPVGEWLDNLMFA